MKLTNEQLKQEEEYILPYHYFDLSSDIYKFFYRKYLSAIDIVKSRIEPFNGQLVLDAGCGDGRFCYELRNENVSIFGIDFSQRAIDFAKIINPHARFFVGELNQLDINTKVDQLVSMEVIEHIPPEILPKVIEQYFNILKFNGILIITVPSINVPRAEKHYQHFSQESLKNLLIKNFEIIEIKGYFDCNSFKSTIYKILREIELLLWPYKKSSFALLRIIGKISKRYSRLVIRYFNNNIMHCHVSNASTLLVVARKK